MRLSGWKISNLSLKSFDSAFSSSPRNFAVPITFAVNSRPLTRSSSTRVDSPCSLRRSIDSSTDADCWSLRSSRCTFVFTRLSRSRAARSAANAASTSDGGRAGFANAGAPAATRRFVAGLPPPGGLPPLGGRALAGGFAGGFTGAAAGAATGAADGASAGASAGGATGSAGASAAAAAELRSCFTRVRAAFPRWAACTRAAWLCSL